METQNNPLADRNIWMYWPNDKASLFDDNYKKGEMTCQPLKGTFSDLSPLIKDIRGFEAAFIDRYGASKELNGTKSFLMDLCLTVRDGDYVLARSSKDAIVGIGIVRGDYFYDYNKTTFNHSRHVEWLARGTWSFDGFINGLWHRVTLIKNQYRPIAEKLICEVCGYESPQTITKLNGCNRAQTDYSYRANDNSEFKTKARKHQEMWVRKWADELGQKSICDERPGHEAWLQNQYARQGLVFYTPFREAIIRLSKMGNTNINMRLLNNALRSEHIPYNIFYPMMQTVNRAKTVALFNELLQTDVIAEILDVKIEYSPQPKIKYLDDQTAFDVYVAYKHRNGHKGAIGIEVKYTEREYSIGEKEYACTHDDNGNVKLCHHYGKATNRSGYYLNNCDEALVSDRLRQVWRNHILGASMVDNGDVAHFTSLTIYPAGNTHFKEVEREYRALLSPVGNEGFKMVTYEDLFEMLTHHFSSTEELKWISYLYDRYLFGVAKPSILNGLEYKPVTLDLAGQQMVNPSEYFAVGKTKILNRGVNQALIEAFKRSPLYSLYQLHTDELIICVRKDYLNIYYRLNNIAQVSLNSCGELVAAIHPFFLKQEGKSNVSLSGDMIKEMIVDRYEEIKQLIQNKKNDTPEKTSQQMLYIQNNANPQSEWYCVDVEWARSFSCIEEKRKADFSARMDIIAVSKDAPHRVAIIELKYGRDSIGGDSGVIKHIADFIKLQKGYDYNGTHYDYYEGMINDICNILTGYEQLGIALPETLRNVTPNDFANAPEFYIMTLDNNLKPGRGSLPKQTMAAYLFSPNSSNYRKWRCMTPAKENVQDKYGIDVLNASSPLTITFIFSNMTIGNLDVNDIIGDHRHEIIRPIGKEKESSTSDCSTQPHPAKRSLWQKIKALFQQN